MAAITGMAPICDWMIKIVKVNKWLLLTACLEAERWDSDVKTPIGVFTRIVISSFTVFIIQLQVGAIPVFSR